MPRDPNDPNDAPDPTLKMTDPQLYRHYLKLTGLDKTRPEIFVDTKEWRALWGHDRRSTFVTLSLAYAQFPECPYFGRGPAFVKERTGHVSDPEMEDYEVAAQHVAELHRRRTDRNIVALKPLDQVLPEMQQAPRKKPVTKRKGKSKTTARQQPQLSP